MDKFTKMFYKLADEGKYLEQLVEDGKHKTVCFVVKTNDEHYELYAGALSKRKLIVTGSLMDVHKQMYIHDWM